MCVYMCPSTCLFVCACVRLVVVSDIKQTSMVRYLVEEQQQRKKVEMWFDTYLKKLTCTFYKPNPS